MSPYATADLFPETVLKPADDPNSRFTTREFMVWIKATVAAELCLREGANFEFDLDPFAHPESCWGLEGWTKADDAYPRQMFGRSFLNGPWNECAQVTQWVVDQLPRNFRLSFCAQVLPGNRQEQDWWQRLVEPIRDRRDRKGIVVTSHYPPGRQNYGVPGAPLADGWGTGLNVNSLLLIWRCT
jgi:hypothetical protein